MGPSGPCARAGRPTCTSPSPRAGEPCRTLPYPGRHVVPSSCVRPAGQRPPGDRALRRLRAGRDHRWRAVRRPVHARGRHHQCAHRHDRRDVRRPARRHRAPPAEREVLHLRRGRHPAGDLLQPEPDRRPAVGDLQGHAATRSSTWRTAATTSTAPWTCPAWCARCHEPAHRLQPGRVDPHPAVRQEPAHPGRRADRGPGRARARRSTRRGRRRHGGLRRASSARPSSP